MTRFSTAIMVALIALFSGASLANIVGALSIEGLRMFLQIAVPAVAAISVGIFLLALRSARQ